MEAKGKDRDEIGFFAKFVLCSNNEHLPVIIDAGETRYWVRKIVPLRSDDTDFLQKLKAEIPTFLHFLQHRQLFTEKESRMWFDPKRLETDALRKIIRSNRNRLEIEMAELLLRWRSRRSGKWCRSAGSWLLHPIRFPTRPTNMTTTVNAATHPSGGLDATTR